MGNTQVQDLAPVRTDERSELNLSRNITHKQYIKVIKLKILYIIVQWSLS